MQLYRSTLVSGSVLLLRFCRCKLNIYTTSRQLCARMKSMDNKPINEDTKDGIEYVDDDTEPVKTLVKLRLPPLLIGLALGIALSFLASRFEEVISHDIRVAFFLPFVVYLSAAVGAQTETIYVRDMRSKQAIFHTYLIKESALGIILGILFGVITAIIIALWFHDTLLAASVGSSIFATVSLAPVVALLVSEVSRKLKEDPAAESGPIMTVIQDMISVLIYGLVCSFFLL